MHFVSVLAVLWEPAAMKLFTECLTILRRGRIALFIILYALFYLEAYNHVNVAVSADRKNSYFS